MYKELEIYLNIKLYNKTKGWKISDNKHKVICSEKNQ